MIKTNLYLVETQKNLTQSKKCMIIINLAL